MRVKFDLPVDQKHIRDLHLGDIVYLNGLIITARDQAHKRILKLKKEGIKVIDFGVGDSRRSFCVA